MGDVIPEFKRNMMKKENFDRNINGKSISIYTLENKNGLKLSVTNFGARVVELWTPDKNGDFKDIVLGYTHIDQYLNNTGERFLGAVCGRYANRIAKGHFTIDENEYNLPINSNGQTLHGGIKGLDLVIWNVTAVSHSAIDFEYLSPDLEEGFPGSLSIQMRYELTDNNEFKITYKAKTDKPTPINLTHHSFFNLHGEGTGTINDHILQINADRYTPVDTSLIPTGELASVKNTSLDFRTPTVIGSRLNDSFEQLTIGNGYDHNWVLADHKRDKPEFAASVLEPQSGRYMEVWTDQPGIQFYGGNFFDGKTKAKHNNNPYISRASFALETQHFPDSPNQPTFPSTLLLPEEEYSHICIYKFSVKN